MHRVDEDLSPIAPLRQPVYRMLWMTWLTANMCMWMNDVAAAWMMTTLSTQPIWVALVQTASTLPVFLLGLPSGALADILDRKRYFLMTQLWVAIVATVLSAMIFFGQISPLTLLLLTFANGIGLAMRWPVFSAIVPELVTKAHLPAALALNGVSMNASRILGPLIAGAVIASLGSAWVFLLNAVLSLLAAATISRWKRVHIAHPLGREKLGTAMRVGLQYVMQSYLLKGVLLRIWIFFFHSTALLALLPLLALRLKGGDAGTFTLLIASMGMGAIASATVLPRLRRRYRRDGLVIRGAGVFALAMATVALTDQVAIAIGAMFCGGMAWIATANTLSLSSQLGLPDWVRARGMSIYQMALMGASASGAVVWGQIATWSNVSISVATASVCGLAAMSLANFFMPDRELKDDLTPIKFSPMPLTADAPAAGRVMVMIEYLVDPVHAVVFRSLMLDQVRRSRLRHGALSWELLHDINAPTRFVELIVDASWTEHLRRFDRFTVADEALREHKLAFHTGGKPPHISRCLMESTAKNS